MNYNSFNIPNCWRTEQSENYHLWRTVRMKKALLVIDMQNVCVGENHAAYFKYNSTDLVEAVNKVIDTNKDNMVIYIKNVMKKKKISLQNMKGMRSLTPDLMSF